MATPETFTRCPGSNCSTVRTSPISCSASGSRNSTSVRRDPALAFFRCPSSALVSLCSGASPKASCTAAYPSRSGSRTPVTGHGPAWITVTGTRVPSSVNTWVIPIFLPMSAATATSGLDLNVDPGGERIQALERVDGLRGRLVDVDQPLVGADLEVLARVLVLERRADHAVDVLVRGQGNGAGDARPGALGRLDDLARSAIDGVVVVRLQTDSDLVSGNRCQFLVLVLSRRWGAAPCSWGAAPGFMSCNARR